MKKIITFVIALFFTVCAFSQEYSSKNKKAIAAYELGLQNYQLLY